MNGTLMRWECAVCHEVWLWRRTPEGELDYRQAQEAHGDHLVEVQQ